jgi:Flp pilus assembly pilin Flp
MNYLKSSIRRFFSNQDGSQSIELVVMAPLLAWSIVAMLAFTDAFRVRAVAADATSVIADTLSRQTTPINDGILEGLQSVAGRLTKYGDAVSLRVTQLRCAEDCDQPSNRVLNVIFSQGKGFAGLSDSDFSSGDMRDRVPMLTNGDRIILVETSFTYKPIFNVGLEESEINMFQATRMRFAPQLCWVECNV